MKFINSIIFIASFLVIISCERNQQLLDENIKYIAADTAANASVKFIHTYAPITPALTTGAGPALQIWRNGQKISGTTAAVNAFTYSLQFPATISYSLLSPGASNFHFIMNRYVSGAFAPQTGDTVFRTTINLEAGKKYSMFLVDSVQSPGVLTVQDNWTVPAPNRYQVRFANLIANPTGRYDIYADSIGRTIITNIGYREVSAFVEIERPNTSENFRVRRTGDTATLYTLSMNPGSQRVYTLFTRGRASTTGRTPLLTFYTNR